MTAFFSRDSGHVQICYLHEYGGTCTDPHTTWVHCSLTGRSKLCRLVGTPPLPP